MTYICKRCEDEFTPDDLREFREMRETYWLEGDTFYCPDCYDSIRRKDLEDQLEYLLKN